MIDMQYVLKQRPDLFDNLAVRWHGATAGELALLSPDGSVIKSYNGVADIIKSVIHLNTSGDIEILPQAKAIITPMISHGELKGHLLSYNSSMRQLPMLTWASEILLDHVNSEQALQSMTDELIVAWDQLELIYRLSQTLAEHTSLSEVLTSTLEEIINVVTVEIAFIIFRVDDHIRVVMAGDKSLPETIFDESLLSGLTNLDQLSLFNNRDAVLEVWPNALTELHNLIAAPVPSSSSMVAALGLINNTKNHEPVDFSSRHAKLITAVSEQIGSIFDYFDLQDQVIAQERWRHELEIAAQIQESLLPGQMPNVSGLDVDVTTLPAYEVGGDFYDFVQNDENQLTAIVGDVAGKGIPAAMITSMVRTMLRVESLHNQEPHVIIQRTNDAVHEDLGRADLFVTAFVATLDTKASVLMYANAGHVPAIIYHAKSQQSRMLTATTLPIGIAGYDFSKRTQFVHVADGDTLVIYSDGVFDASDPNGEQFGIEKIRQLVHDHIDEPPDRLKEIILNNLADTDRSEQRADDVTLIVIRFALQTTKPKQTSSREVVRKIPFNYLADTVHLTEICGIVTKACRSLASLPSDSKGDDFVYLVELAVSEIFTNIIEHAYAGSAGTILGELTLTTAGIEFDIYDEGESFNPNAIPPPMSDPMDPSEGGFGLHIVRQIMDVAEYSVDRNNRNHWKLVKYLPE